MKQAWVFPRTINIICDTALVYAYADDLKNINASVIQQVIEDREGTGLSYHPAEMTDQRIVIRIAVPSYKELRPSKRA